jgi:hypothetical protein
VCDALSKKAKKGCKKGIKKDAKFDKKSCKGIIVADCKAATATDTCSPSAAFLDSDVIE